LFRELIRFYQNEVATLHPKFIAIVARNLWMEIKQLQQANLRISLIGYTEKIYSLE
jgi:hypothetical protein